MFVLSSIRGAIIRIHIFNDQRCSQRTLISTEFEIQIQVPFKTNDAIGFVGDLRCTISNNLPY